MFLQFTDLYGQPVYVRPERVDAVKGIVVTRGDYQGPASLIVMANRETFRVRCSVHVVAVELGRVAPSAVRDFSMPQNSPFSPVYNTACGQTGDAQG